MVNWTDKSYIFMIMMQKATQFQLKGHVVVAAYLRELQRKNSQFRTKELTT